MQYDGSIASQLGLQGTGTNWQPKILGRNAQPFCIFPAVRIAPPSLACRGAMRETKPPIEIDGARVNQAI
jgi:hypothetical protein